MAIWSHVAFILFGSVITYAADDVFYPQAGNGERLATKIHCRVNESRTFTYESVTKLWNDLDEQILLRADVTLHCLGEDASGPFGSQALRYLAEVSNLFMEEKHQIIEDTSTKKEPILRRRKRGISDFFSSAWKSVKNFFVRLFGGTPEEETQKRHSIPESDRSGDEIPTTESPEDTMPFDEGFDATSYTDLYSHPFEFIQFANGSVPQIRFIPNDTDTKVRNFKRHLVDAFATQLVVKPSHYSIDETSVMGDHRTYYNITMGSPPSIVTAGLSYYTSKTNSDVVVVDKTVTNDDILKLAPVDDNKALNNKEKMNLRTRQTQVFTEGELMSSTGQSSIVLFPEKSGRRKRDTSDSDGVTAYFQASSEYKITFHNRRKRSVDDNVVDGTVDGPFVAATRSAEKDDSHWREKLLDQRNSLGNATKFLLEIVNTEKNDSETLQTVFEVVQQEVNLGLDKLPNSVAEEVRNIVTKQAVEKLFEENFGKGADLLQLLARAGGSQAERVLIDFVSDVKVSHQRRQQVVDYLSDLPNPSSESIRMVLNLMMNTFHDPQLVGSLSLSVSNMAAKSNEANKVLAADTLVSLLESRTTGNSKSTDFLILDILEAMGNLGHQRVVDSVLRVSAANENKLDIQIAAVHALRHLLTTNNKVQRWMSKAIDFGSCDVIQAIAGALTDEIIKQETNGDESRWPRNGINEIDTKLFNGMSTSVPEFECATADIKNYLLRKTQSSLDVSFEDKVDSITRRKRSVLDGMNCREWIDDDKYHPIQEKTEFVSDQVTYNKRKSCLATRELGVDGARSEIYAGMFAGVKQPSDPPKYKLFTKFVSGVRFLGNDLEIGSFYFYHQNGQTKAYVRVLGRTRQEFRNSECTPTELKYRPMTHIPVYEIPVSVLTFSLGVHMSSEVSLDTLCPKEDMYDLKPRTRVRVAGEALGTVLFLRGAINLGGNFNYFLRYSFTPVPDMCLRGAQGYDPMSISLEAYYQLWRVTRLGWSTRRVWQPSFLKWDVSRGQQQLWFNNTCVLRSEDSGTTTTDLPTEDRDNSLVANA